MRVPIIPLLVAVGLLGGAILLLNVFSTPPRPSLAAPEVAFLMDLEGIESETAISPDGVRYAVVASGDLWLAESGGGPNRRLTHTAAAESAPSWTPGGNAVTFTRGADTFQIDVESGQETLLMAAATDMDWSANGRCVFVRARALWLGEPGRGDARELVPADTRPDPTIRSPRFSPSGNRVAFIKTILGLRGEVWTVNVSGGDALPVVADRNAENPTSVDWILDDLHLVYMTNRSGGLAVWFIDQESATLVPITHPLMGLSLEPLGIAVHGPRVVVPRHSLDTAIAVSDGTVLVDTAHMELDPALSPDGQSIAYTVDNDGVLEIWIADADGSDLRHVALGQHPRWSPGGNELVYSRTDLKGNRDIWKVDIRSGVPERLTDAAGIDDLPDWSPDGRSIVFSSLLYDGLAMWTVPSTGGQRLKLADGGYAPRFFSDGRGLAYWHDGALWTRRLDLGPPSLASEADRGEFGPGAPGGPEYSAEGWIRTGSRQGPGPRDWPGFDRLPDGGWLVAALEVQKTELWTIDLRFTEN